MDSLISKLSYHQAFMFTNLMGSHDSGECADRAKWGVAYKLCKGWLDIGAGATLLPVMSEMHWDDMISEVLLMSCMQLPCCWRMQ